MFAHLIWQVRRQLRQVSTGMCRYMAVPQDDMSTGDGSKFTSPPLWECGVSKVASPAMLAIRNPTPLRMIHDKQVTS